MTISLDGNLYFANLLVSDSREDFICNAYYTTASVILPKDPIAITVTACVWTFFCQWLVHITYFISITETRDALQSRTKRWVLKHAQRAKKKKKKHWKSIKNSIPVINWGKMLYMMIIRVHIRYHSGTSSLWNLYYICWCNTWERLDSFSPAWSENDLSQMLWRSDEDCRRSSEKYFLKCNSLQTVSMADQKWHHCSQCNTKTSKNTR